MLFRSFDYIRELELLREAGFNPLEVIRAATYHGALQLHKPKGMENDLQFGVLEAGMKADMIVVEENPLENLKVLYGTGTPRLNDDTGEVERVGQSEYVLRLLVQLAGRLVCIDGTGTIARGHINWQVLIVIGAALGMGRALQDTGAADGITALIFGAASEVGLGDSPHAMLLLVFLVTAIASQLITNNGAAVLMFPITMTIAQDLGTGPLPFLFTLMVAAGSSFMSPIAYQTNLMVYGPGGYRFTD